MATRKTFSQSDRSGLTVRQGDMKGLEEAIKALVGKEVLVGVPGETTARPTDPEAKSPVTNAELAYIHDNGAPERNIPARPFMRPGIEAVQDKLTDALAKTAQKVLSGGGASAVDAGLTRVGLLAQASIQATIRRGVPPPLAEATLRDRARRGRKGAQQELDNRAAGLAATLTLATPLMDTGEMLKSITYVIRNKKG